VASSTEYLDRQIRQDRATLARSVNELMKTVTILAAGYDPSLDQSEQSPPVQAAWSQLTYAAGKTLADNIALTALEAVPRA
jgi:hypothetical protein